MRTGAWRLSLRLMACVVATGLSLVAPAVPGVSAAAPELQVTSAARYDVLPDKGRIHITLDATVTNTHRDSGTTRSYFDTAYLAVLPGTANFRVTSPGAKPVVSIRSQTRSYTLLTIKLGRRLFAGHHTALNLQFDLPDKGGSAQRDVRVGPSLVAFPAWAFATPQTPGGSLTVVFPPGYSVLQQAGDLPDPTTGTGGTIVYRSGTLRDPLAFAAYFVADRPGTYSDVQLQAAVAGAQVPITIRAWKDDPAWGTRVGSLVRRGLPALAGLIGIPFRGSGIVAQESVGRSIGGYAGVFDPVSETIQVAYSAGSFVVLHETAHAWFNGRLASDRWILEAFASWYAEQAALVLKIKAEPPDLTRELRAAAIPLNAWPAVGRADEATEDYAYAATYHLGGLIALRAGAAGLRAVWRAADAGEYAYQSRRTGAVREIGAGRPDWRGLLDLLEERTPKTYADLWTTWVVRPAEAGLLAERAAARAAYAAAIKAAGGWELPSGIRRALSAWQFPTAQGLIAQAQAVLQQRAAITAAAADAGLRVPPAVRTLFEGTGGSAAASAEAERELETIEVLVEAQRAGLQAVGMVADLGLLGAAPASEMQGARSAFADGNMAGAQSHALSAQGMWRTAEERGWQRLISIAAVMIGLLVFVVATALLVRMRRARVRPAPP